MTLIWKLLRRHVSLPQLGGFFLANLLGLCIVMTSVQAYHDILPAFSGEDGFLPNTYVILSKRVSATSALGGHTASFTEAEIADLARQPFARRVGRFTSSRYKVFASIAMGERSVGTDMFFESVPDDFVDADLAGWHFEAGATEIPIILPRSYLAIYNFGFAESQSLPKLSEGVVAMVRLDVTLRGRDMQQQLRGRVVGFSNRLNTILVPEDFMRWSNATLASGAEQGPTRLIVEVANPADDAIPAYVQAHGYETGGNDLDAGRATYMLKIASGVVVAVGLLISGLSFFVLMLSIYLLVEKNSAKLHNLLLIGYTPSRVSLPYQALTVGINLAVLVLAVVLLYVVRGRYMELLWQMFPQMSEGPTSPALAFGASLFVLVSAFNILAIRHKINVINRPQ
ncbi:MAG: ABC transporter permease [Bacteroidaceae bacterium]|nr:ABC transporter permease [Bacteroidaceae bacterium]